MMLYWEILTSPDRDSGHHRKWVPPKRNPLVFQNRKESEGRNIKILGPCFGTRFTGPIPMSFLDGTPLALCDNNIPVTDIYNGVLQFWVPCSRSKNGTLVFSPPRFMTTIPSAGASGFLFSHRNFADLGNCEGKLRNPWHVLSSSMDNQDWEPSSSGKNGTLVFLISGLGMPSQSSSGMF